MAVLGRVGCCIQGLLQIGEGKGTGRAALVGAPLLWSPAKPSAHLWANLNPVSSSGLLYSRAFSTGLMKPCWQSSWERITEDLFHVNWLLVFLLLLLWQEWNLNQGVSLLWKPTGGNMKRKQELTGITDLHVTSQKLLISFMQKLPICSCLGS